ncbi:MAG: molybdopterin molybdotransferase MoeA [Actinobacteria bacterium]|nr:molybdopterin molybdotransferase MoeA [Actinomycetota bacterium]
MPNGSGRAASTEEPSGRTLSPDGLLSIGAAQALIAAHITTLGVEPVGLADAHGRFVAEDVRAVMDLPPFSSSAMDGYALRAADTPGPLRVIGESAAGSPFAGRLEPGDAVVISTGAVVPASADSVVPVERVSRTGDTVEIKAAVPLGDFIRAPGSDIQTGSLVLAAGTRLGPAQIGAAAAAGLGTLSCHRRPRVAVLTTGSELRPPGHPLEIGEIYDANGPMLTAALRGTGAEVRVIPAVGDEEDAHRTALGEALEHDVVISSGGVSMGTHDLVRSVGGELGIREVFWKVALRPGKPIAFGVRDTTLVFGLPGNPVSTLVCFELFVRPALLALQGSDDARPAFSAGRLGAAVTQNPERDDLIRVRVDTSGGTPVLWPLAGQQSHQITVTAQADALALIPTGTGEFPAGTDVSFLPLQRA